MAKRIPLTRLNIPHFEGVNAFSASHVSRAVEFKHVENARSMRIGILEKRRGTLMMGNNLSETASFGLFYFENNNNNSNGLYKVVTSSGITKLYYYNTSSSTWNSIRSGLSNAYADYTIAEDSMFVVNGVDNGFFVEDDGTTIVSSGDTSLFNHLYKMPLARKINYYKDRLYIADYNYGSQRVKNGVGISSRPMGLISLVNEDAASGSTEIKVTDTTYIRSDGTDQLEVFRGGTLKGTLVVTGKTEEKITVSSTSFSILSSDELWVKGTYGDAPKVFRWPDILGGKNSYEQKNYDTFKLSGEQNGSITMMTNVGDIMIFANRENIGIWNNHYEKSLNIGIGCASDYGYVKALGTLWFLDYNGIYATSGGYPKLMSSKVEPYIKGATKAGLENATMGRKGFSIFCAIGDVTLYHEDGSAKRKLKNVVLEYNLRQTNWYVHTGINAVNFATYKDDNEAELLAYNDGGYAGNRTYEFLNKDKYTDDNNGSEKNIPFRVDSIDITLSTQFEIISYPQEVIVETLRGSVLEAFISLDRESYYRVTGDISKGCTVIKTTSEDKNIAEPRCRQLSVSLRDFTDKPCVISRMAIMAIRTLEIENNNEDNILSINK